MGVAVTRKPTSTPGDHVKHPERLGVRRHDAGEAIAAMVTGRSWGVGVCCVLLAALRPSMRSGATARMSGILRTGSSASPRLLLVPVHLS